jgi:hypothetical protein
LLEIDTKQVLAAKADGWRFSDFADHFYFAFLSPQRDAGESKVKGGATSEMAFRSKKVTEVKELKHWSC